MRRRLCKLNITSRSPALPDSPGAHFTLARQCALSGGGDHAGGGRLANPNTSQPAGKSDGHRNTDWSPLFTATDQKYQSYSPSSQRKLGGRTVAGCIILFIKYLIRVALSAARRISVGIIMMCSPWHACSYATPADDYSRRCRDFH